MGIFIKGQKKKKEPQYYVSATNMPVYNYKVYYMKALEKLLYFLVAFAIGGAVGYLFYGGIGKNEFNEPTKTTIILDILFSVVTGLIAGKLYLPIRNKQILNKKRKNLKLQFRELLDSLSTSIGSGKNIVDSFKSSYFDLQIIYSEDDDIIKELQVIIDGIENNIDIEKSLMDFAIRSGIEDVESFANVFETCYRKGGNIKDVIKNTQQIISEKMEVEQEIETIVTGSKTEQTIMSFMPIGIIGVIKFMSADFAKNFATPVGIAATTIGIIAFILAYFIGKAILAIKI